VGDQLRAIFRTEFGHEDVRLSQCHHNCLMTKHPGYSSATLWHQDIRYWRFAAPDLVNAWLALGPEGPGEGGMRVIPGSHRLDLAPGRFDDEQFLGEDLAENAPLIARAVDLELDCGDVLFFHCRLLHAAGRNRSARVKRSLVFTYNPVDNPPLPGTRSARLAQIPV
jgi:phytanoyl-CoA hydroxylase